MALSMSGLPKLVFLFVNPWYRATVYTGDRIAYACCGDLNVSLQAVYRVLVGREVAPHLLSGGLVAQALAIRRNPILRLGQLLRKQPHVSNRYLELLAFAEGWEPAGFSTFRSTLGVSSGDVDGVLSRLRARRPLNLAVPVALLLSALLLAGAIVAGQRLQDTEIVSALAPVESVEPPPVEPPPVEPPPVEPPPVEPPPVEPPPVEPPPVEPPPVDQLLNLLPVDVRALCQEFSETEPALSSGLVTAVGCSVSGAGLTTLSYYAYEDQAAMAAAFDWWATNTAEDTSCEPGGQRRACLGRTLMV